MPGSRQKTVTLPRPLVERVEKVITLRREWGYTSVASFVSDAVRRRLEEIEKAQEVGG